MTHFKKNVKLSYQVTSIGYLEPLVIPKVIRFWSVLNLRMFFSLRAFETYLNQAKANTVDFWQKI